MRRIIADCETDGLLPELTKVHSLVLRDLDSDRCTSCADTPGFTPIAQGLQVLAEASELYFHNGQGFDIPALKKVYPGWTYRGQLYDTFILARMRWAHIKDSDFRRKDQGKLPGNLIGRHSLEAWGHRMGNYKGGFDGPWEHWSPEMQAYCEQDTSVLKSLVQLLYKHKFSQHSSDIEHQLARYLENQERNGWPFDVEKGAALQAKLVGRRESIDVLLKEQFGSWEKDLGLFVPKVNNKKRGYQKGVPIRRTKTITFNPGSRDHISNRLTILYGWKPAQFTTTGKPKVDESTIGKLPYPNVPLLLERFLVEKRLGSLAEGKESWMYHLESNRPEGGLLTGLPHVHGRVNPAGTVTGRPSYSKPNMSQVPNSTAEYGPECRALFTVPKGWKLVGSDSSSLELRCLAHYMARYDGGTYGKSVVEGRQEDGTDPHSQNRNALGWEGKRGRADAKTWFYALVYGAGDEKLGSGDKALGKKLRKRFLKNLPAMGAVVKSVQKDKKGRSRKFVVLPDGRRAYIRSEHSALNTLLQGAGAIICKAAIVYIQEKLEERFGPQGWDKQWAACGWIVDEIQIACREEIAEEVARICVEGWRHPTQLFKWRCPLDGEAHIGSNWNDTH